MEFRVHAKFSLRTPRVPATSAIPANSSPPHGQPPVARARCFRSAQYSTEPDSRNRVAVTREITPGTDVLENEAGTKSRGPFDKAMGTGMQNKYGAFRKPECPAPSEGRNL